MTDEFIISQYLQGKLSRKEEMLFVNRIKSDPSFKEKVLIKILLIKSIRNVGKRRDQQIIKSIRSKLTWKKYILIYGMYGNYYFTDNMSRYNVIFNRKSDASIM